MQIFGFEIKRKQDSDLPSVVTPSPVETGATVINTGVNAGGHYGMVMDLEGTIKNENDLIRRYREVSQYSDCDGAIEDIVNEAIVADESKRPIEIMMDQVKVSSGIKKKIEEEFDNVLKLLHFNDSNNCWFNFATIVGLTLQQLLV